MIKRARARERETVREKERKREWRRGAKKDDRERRRW